MYYQAPDGVRVYYEKAGGGAPVMLLHPIGLDTEFWNAQTEELARRFAVYTADFRGHGRSEKPRDPYSLSELADDVIGICRQEGLRDVVLGGLSMGGMVAQIAALKEPSLFAGLILADTNMKGHTEAMERRARIVSEGGMTAEADETLRRWFTEETLRDDAELVQRTRERLLADDPQVHSWGWIAIGQLDVRDRLQEIRMPCLVIVGREDPSTPPQLAKDIAGRISGSRYVELAGASHMASLEKPREFNAAVTAFLDDVPRQ